MQEYLQSNMHVQKEIFNTEENEVTSSGTSITTALTNSQSYQENGNIRTRQRRGNTVKSKKAWTSLKAKKSSCKAKRVYAKYPINHKEKKEVGTQMWTLRVWKLPW